MCHNYFIVNGQRRTHTHTLNNCCKRRSPGDGKRESVRKNRHRAQDTRHTHTIVYCLNFRGSAICRKDIIRLSAFKVWKMLEPAWSAVTTTTTYIHWIYRMNFDTCIHLWSERTSFAVSQQHSRRIWINSLLLWPSWGAFHFFVLSENICWAHRIQRMHYTFFIIYHDRLRILFRRQIYMGNTLAMRRIRKHCRQTWIEHTKSKSCAEASASSKPCADVFTILFYKQQQSGTVFALLLAHTHKQTVSILLSQSTHMHTSPRAAHFSVSFYNSVFPLVPGVRWLDSRTKPIYFHSFRFNEI